MFRRVAKLMVAEDDPQWVRFWNVYPSRSAKKDARVAWLQVNPSAALVDRMLETLAWQTRLWATQGYGMPYPASWLRGERWTDEPPAVHEARSITPTHYGTCTHTPKCGSAWECQELKAKAAK